MGALCIIDGFYYHGNIKFATKDHYFLVEYIGIEGHEFLSKDDIRKSENIKLGQHKSFLVSKQRICVEKNYKTIVSEKFLIRENDDDATIEKKRKIMKSFKKQNYYAKLES